MKDLAVLTPPFLMAAVVITAIVAFLRHEMGRGHADGSDVGNETPEPAAEADGQHDSEPADGTRSSASSARDS